MAAAIMSLFVKEDGLVKKLSINRKKGHIDNRLFFIGLRYA